MTISIKYLKPVLPIQNVAGTESRYKIESKKYVMYAFVNIVRTLYVMSTGSIFSGDVPKQQYSSRQGENT